jgi:hypothetical protein
MAIADGDAVELFYDADGEIAGIRWNPNIPAKEREAMKAKMYEMMHAMEETENATDSVINKSEVADA